MIAILRIFLTFASFYGIISFVEWDILWVQQFGEWTGSGRVFLVLVFAAWAALFTPRS